MFFYWACFCRDGEIVQDKASAMEEELANKFLSYPIPKAIVEEWEKFSNPHSNFSLDYILFVIALTKLNG